MQSSLKFIAAVFIAATMFISTNVKAQTVPANGWTFGIGPELGLPTGVAKLGATFTLGATGRFQYGLTNDLAVTFTAGGYHFFPKTIPGTDRRYQSYGELPVKAGLKAFFVPNIYIGAEAGAAFEKLQQGWGPHRLDLSPAVGYANKHWDIGLHYDYMTRSEDHLGTVSLRLGYGFGL